jgi:hypothetical protein
MPLLRRCATAIAACFTLCCLFTSAPASVLINEFMASNRSTLADEDGDFEDWIELVNTGTSPVDLTGWGLSDDPADPFRWTFPANTSIDPGGFILVWASGKDRSGQNNQNPQAAPDSIDGLVVWLRADTAPLANGEEVSTWLDSSGRGNHATQPTASQRPTFTTNALNGLPALQFNRANSQQLFLPTASFNGMTDLSNFTFLTVARWTGGVQSGLFGGYRGSSTLNAGSSVFEITQASGSIRLRLPSPIDTTAASAIPLNQWSLIGASMDKPAALASIFRNGSTVAQASGTPGTSLLANFERLPVGSSFDATRTFGGQIAEVLIYNRGLTDTERAKVERHLDRKYNLNLLNSPTVTLPHTNFRISASGESLVLTRPDGSTADETPPVALAQDQSFGRPSSAPSSLAILATPTPGAANSGVLIPPPPPVSFSHPSGIHPAPFTLALSHPDPTATIVYTTDGSEPDIERLGGSAYQFRSSYNTGPLIPMSTTSLTYQGPITVTDRSPQPNRVSLIPSTSDSNPTYLPSSPVKKATVIRARAYVNGSPGPATAATFLVSESGAFNYPMPIVSILFNEADMFDYNRGIYVAGIDHVTSTGGRICNYGNFNRRGPDAEASAHFHFFQNGQLAFESQAGIRIHGNCSRRNAFKSIRFHSRSSLDNSEGEIDFPFFPETVPDAVVPENTRHKRLILRSPSINEVSFCRLYQPIYGGVGGRLSPVMKFFNGEFWGLSYLRDRLDEHYLARHYNLSPDNLALVNIKYGHEVGSSALRVFNLDSGIPSDMDDFWAMRNFINGNSMAVEANYQKALQLLDTRSFIDHLILKIFAGDDHYAPEYIFWRARSPEDSGFGDGRWRVMVKDFDSTLFTANYVTGLATGTHPRAFGFEIFQSLLANPSFRHDFINRFADLLNAHFTPSRFQSIINAAFDEASPVWAEAAARWNNAAFSNPNRPFTTTQRNNLITWSNDHPPRQRSHIRQHFAIPSDVALTVSTNDPSQGHIRVNSIPIAADTPGIAAQPYPWTGSYFQNIPVPITAVPAPGHRFAGWKIGGASTITSTSRTLTLPMSSATSVEAIFEPIFTVHGWNFEHPQTFLTPSSSVGGNAGISPTLPPGGEILRNTTAQGFASAHLRINNPVGTTLTLNLPTTGFTGITLSYDARRSTQGAAQHSIETSIDGSSWLPFTTYTLANQDPQSFVFDLSTIPGASNNPLFSVRINISQGEGGTTGNNRFDNLILAGAPISNAPPPSSITFLSVPVATQSGSSLPPITVRLLDANGNPATSYNGPVTLALSGSGSLSGNLTATAVFGTAVFENLSLSAVGQVALTASAPGLPSTASLPIRSLALTGLSIPLHIQGGTDASNENHNRVPFAWLARVDGLQPNATYRFANRAVLPTDSPTSDGAGNMILVTGPDSPWIRTTQSPGFLPGDENLRHSTFAASADGSFTGWFVTEPTGNSRFTPGNDLHLRLLLNDGNGGTEATHVLTTGETTRVLQFGSLPTEGSAISGTTQLAPRHFAVLHSQESASSRPLAATPVEATGAAIDDRFAPFYQSLAATSTPSWGTIIPNTLPSGIRRIDFFAADGTLLQASLIEPDGFAGTVDPSAGLASPILIAPSSLPPADTFAGWRLHHFPDPADQANEALSGPNAHPSGDGIPNLLRFALGVSPTEPAAHLLPRIATHPDGSLHFHFRFDPAKQGLTWLVRSSLDLLSWEETLFHSADSSPPVPTPDGWTPIPIPRQTPQRFLRLELTLD